MDQQEMMTTMIERRKRGGNQKGNNKLKWKVESFYNVVVHICMRHGKVASCACTMLRHKFSPLFLLPPFCPEGTVKQYGYTQRGKKEGESGKRDENIGNRWKYFYESVSATTKEKKGKAVLRQKTQIKTAVCPAEMFFLPPSLVAE